MKNKIKKAFKECYPNKRLLACKINDMYITIWFDNGKASDDIEQEGYFFWTKEDTDGNMSRFASLVGVGAYTYWHTCWTNTWIQPNER